MAQGPYMKVVTGGYVKCGDQDCSLKKHNGGWELIVEEVSIARSTEWPLFNAVTEFGGSSFRAKITTCRPYLGV